MRFACWLTKVTNAHLEYITLTAFQQQQWLWELSSILRYNVCLIVLGSISAYDTESYKRLGGYGQAVSVELHY